MIDSLRLYFASFLSRGKDIEYDCNFEYDYDLVHEFDYDYDYYCKYVANMINIYE